MMAALGQTFLGGLHLWLGSVRSENRDAFRKKFIILVGKKLHRGCTVKMGNLLRQKRMKRRLTILIQERALLVLNLRESNMSPITLSILWRFFLLGLLGICLVQAIAYTGIKYSSPTLAASLGNLMPGFTFLLAIIFRMETLDMRKASSQAKSVGTIVAIVGATIMTLYKGPRVLGSISPSDTSHHSLLSQESNWILGGLLITATCIMSSGWNILQTDTVKKYPEKMTIVFFTCCFGSIQCAILTLALERNPDAWMLKPGIGMIAIVFSAVSGSVFRYNVLTWCLDKKGPLYVAMFKPLGMVIAAILGIIFLADTLHLGSVIGAIIISAGFYSVLWGKAQEKSMLEVEDMVCGIDSSNQRSPLLLK